MATDLIAAEGVEAAIDRIKMLVTIRAAFNETDLAIRDRRLALPRLLAHTCRFQASDFRDHFFALYGLTSMHLASRSMVPDYVSPSNVALCRAVMSTMQLDKSLRLLELTDCEGMSDQPSWVPGPRLLLDPQVFPLSKLSQDQNTTIMDSLDLFSGARSKALDEKYPEQDWDNHYKVMARIKQKWNRQVEKFTGPPIIPLDYIELEDSTTLCLKGHLLDRIQQTGPVILLPADLNRGYGCVDRDNDSNIVGEVIFGDAPFFEVLKTWRQLLRAVLDCVFKSEQDWVLLLDAFATMDVMVTSHKHSAYASRKELITAYRNTVCAGQWNVTSDGQRHPFLYKSHIGNTSDEVAAAAFEDWRSCISGGVLIRKLKSSIGLKGTIGRWGLYLSSILITMFYLSSWNLMVANAMLPLLGRRLAWTATGRLALVPAKSEPGDMIFSLRGGDMPFVLRPVGNVFQLLGPTYFDGYMNGELANVEGYGPVKII